MNPKKTFLILLLIVGEIILILSFLHFGKNLSSNLLILNIFVSTIIYSLFFIEILLPVVDFKDKSQSRIGAIGIRWFSTNFYIMSAIFIMIYFNSVKPIEVNSQLIVHLILIFFLSMSFFFSKTASNKVNEVFLKEEENSSNLEVIKSAIKKIQFKLETLENIPSSITSSFKTLQENYRFISPSNNQIALELEKEILTEINSVYDYLFLNPINYEKINLKIQKCESIYKERKQISSN
jgi:hypothetical protein